MNVTTLSIYVKDQRTWGNYRCYCGKEFTTRKYYVDSGRTKSCGCLKHDIGVIQGKKTIHGLTKTPEWNTWKSMIERCLNPKHVSYKYYGGKGVSVCREWFHSPAAFLADMGPKPSPKHQLDRIDSSKDYTPENCRWVSPKENARNRSNNKTITFMRETLTYSAWAEKIGMKRETLTSRIRDGWDPVRAITTPVRIRL